MNRKLLPLSLAASGVVFLNLSCASVQKPNAAPYESAILQENWSALVKGPQRYHIPNATVSAFLKAHSLIATNENDAAVCSFAELQNPVVISAWRAWTQSFLQAHPKSATAHYLQGDALARAGDADAAVKEFGKALSINRQHTLSLNARGIVETIYGHYDEALIDFQSAESINPVFAEASTNRGFLYIRSKGSGQSQLKPFEAALASNPHSTLAALGRGQALVATGKAILGLSGIDNATHSCAYLQTLAESDRKRLFDWVKANGLRASMGVSKEEAGTTLLSLLKQAAQNRDPGSFGKAIDFVASTGDADLQKKLTMTLQSMEKTDPQMGNVIGQAINEKSIANETLHNNLLKQESVKTSTEAKLGLDLGNGDSSFGASVKATASSDLATYAKDQLSQLEKDQSLTDTLKSQLRAPSQQDGGAETVLIGLAPIDRGDAPRFYHNGLLYPEPALKHEI